MLLPVGEIFIEFVQYCLPVSVGVCFTSLFFYAETRSLFFKRLKRQIYLFIIQEIIFQMGNLYLVVSAVDATIKISSSGNRTVHFLICLSIVFDFLHNGSNI